MGDRDGGGALNARGAVFLDRDGVLDDVIVPAGSTGPAESPLRVSDVRLATGAAQGVRALRQAGWLLIGASNQPGAAKGQVTLSHLRAVHERVVVLLAAEGAALDGWEYCLHHPDGVGPGLGGPCPCRKPAPGMLLTASFRHGVDLSTSWMVGDTDADIAAGAAVGARTVLVEHPGSSHKRAEAASPNTRVADLAAAAAFIAATGLLTLGGGARPDLHQDLR